MLSRQDMYWEGKREGGKGRDGGTEGGRVGRWGGLRRRVSKLAGLHIILLVHLTSLSREN